MTFEVNRQQFSETRSAPDPAVALTPGQVRLAIERCALTTNNITYAVAGDMLDYWGFFPAEQPWGRIPAMGLGTVSESANPDIAEGGRYYGFYPLGPELVIDAQARKTGFRDVGAHRANHAPVYRDFVDVEHDPLFSVDHVDEYLLFRGLFMTSFLIDDFLADNDFFGATQTVVTSASSKTSIALADCLMRRGHHSIGVTSDRNRAFVEQLGMYDQVITYGEIDTLDSAIPSVLVDMAGGGVVAASIHGHYVDALKHSAVVGATHGQEPAGDVGPLAGPTPEFFFAPAQIVKRSDDWGVTELMRLAAGTLHALLEDTHRWMSVETRTGPDGIATTYQELLDGSADPAIGFIVHPTAGAWT